MTLKRKRSAYIPQAIDPCLGYYLSSETAEPYKTSGVKNVTLHVDPVLEHRYRVQDMEVVPSSFQGEWEAETPEVDAQMQKHSSQGSTSPELESFAEWTEFIPSTRPLVVNQKVMGTVPDACHDIQNDKKPGEPMLTVEEFLKRSAKQGNNKLRHTYGKKGKRKSCTKKLNAEQGSQSGFPPTTRGNHYPVDVKKDENKMTLTDSSVSKRKQAKASKQKKTLKQRLYEAVISTYGDPGPHIIGAPGDFSEQTPAPLKFLPGGTVGESSNKKQRRKDGRLVNPRKFMVNHDAEFLSRVRVPGSLLRNNRSPDECRGKTTNKWAWNEDLDVPSIDFLGSRAILEPQKSKFPNKKQKFKEDTYEKGRSSALTCGALTFIPMKEAEASYSALFAKKMVYVVLSSLFFFILTLFQALQKGKAQNAKTCSVSFSWNLLLS